MRVEASRSRDSNSALLDLQRKSSSIIEGLSAEQINKVGALDVGSAVRRMTGLTVERGKYVYVRGLGDRYNKVFLNGASIPSLDPDRNSTQLDIFPAHLIDNMVVHKSFNPSLSGNFAGGYLDIETKSVNSHRTLSVGLSTSYNANANFHNQFMSYESGVGDFFVAGKQYREVPAEAKGVPTISQAQRQGGETAAALSSATRAFAQSQLAPVRGNAFLNHNFKATYGDRFFIAGRQVGYTISLTHVRQYDAYRGGTSGIYKPVGRESRTLVPLYTLRDSNSTEDVLLGGMLGLNYRFAPGNSISFVFLHSRKGTKSARHQGGHKPEDAPDLQYFTNGLWYTQRQLFTYQLLGQHALGDKFGLNWVGSYTLSRIDQPNLRFFTFGDRDNQKPRVEPSTGQLPTHYYRDMREDLADVRVHFTYLLRPDRKFIIGTSYGLATRAFNEERFGYADNLNGIVPEGDPNLYTPDRIWTAENDRGVYILNDTDEANSYTGRRNVIGGYAMYDGVLAGSFTLNAGLRYESTDITVHSADLTQADGILRAHDVLPAAQLAWRSGDQWVVRASYGRTVARPSFRELAPYTSFDFIGDYLLVGNAALKRTNIDNVELRGEWYRKQGSIISFSAFYKRFKNPIERTFNTDATNVELTFRNVNRANVFGVELNIEQDLDFIAPALRELQVGANAALIHSSVTIDAEELDLIRAYDASASSTRPLFGQSPYVINVFLGYTYKSWGLNASYNIFGKRITIVTRGGPNIFEQPRHDLQANMSKQWGNWRVRFSVKNILNAAFTFNQTHEGVNYTYQQYRLGQTFSIGASYTLQ